MGCSCSQLLGLEMEIKSSSSALMSVLPIGASGGVLAVGAAIPSSFSSRYLIHTLSLCYIAESFCCEVSLSVTAKFFFNTFSFPALLGRLRLPYPCMKHGEWCERSPSNQIEFTSLQTLLLPEGNPVGCECRGSCLPLCVCCFGLFFPSLLLS